jgi:peptidoglycan/xylan/chitin deacetylase (PgdA/CDA1 family)
VRSLLVALILALAASAAQAKQAIVSFTFDDVPKSVITVGLPILEQYDFPATIYVATGNVIYPDYMNWDDIALAAKHGWEVAAHTHTHRDLTKLSDSEILDDLLTSTQEFAKHGYAPVDFATPFGEFDDRVLAILKRHYQSHRTAWPHGMNISTPDPYRIISYDVEQSTTLEQIRTVLENLQVDGGWVVFQMHHLAPKSGEVDDQYGTSLLEDIASLVDKKGFAVLTVNDALRQLQEGAN